MLHPRGPLGVSVHTVDGRVVASLPHTVVPACNWTRTLSEVSTCQLTLTDPEVRGLTPWHHWITVWDGQHNVWTGPIQRVQESRSAVQVTARDVSTFMWRTRMAAGTWEGLDTAVAAAEVWASMLDLHRVAVAPKVGRSLAGTVFTLTADSAGMVHKFIADLTGLGLAWTVVAGRPVLGALRDDAPLAVLGEDDLVADVEVVRDGTNTYNDVLVRGQDHSTLVLAELDGLHLQTTVSMDNLRGATNVQAGAREYLAQVSGIRDTLLIPSGASLRLDQPFGIDDLVPGATVTVYARGLSSRMRLDQVTVDSTPGTYSVAVTLTGLGDGSAT